MNNLMLSSLPFVHTTGKVEIIKVTGFTIMLDHIYMGLSMRGTKIKYIEEIFLKNKHNTLNHIQEHIKEIK